MNSQGLDQFRILLDHLDADDRADVLAFFRFVDTLGEEAVAELGPRLQKSMATRGLRLLVLESAFYHPWTEWLTHLSKPLRHEPDLGLFEAGVRAVGRIRTPQSAHLLRELHTIRQAEAFQEITGRVLAETDPAEAFTYHLGRLLEGSANSRVANEAAAELARVVNADSLQPLLVVVQHPDLLVARHALRLVTCIPTAEAAAFLKAHLEECHQETLVDRRLKEELGFFRGAGPVSRADALGRLRQALGGRRPDALAVLESEGESLGTAGAALLQELRAEAADSAEAFLVEASTLVLEGKSVKLAALAAEALERLAQHGRRLAFALDLCAEGLGAMVRQRLIAEEAVLPVLREAYREGTGHEGLARVLGQLVAPGDADTMALILGGQDPAARGAAIEALGSRHEEDLLPFLLRACQDPIVDLAQKAMVALGQLGGAQGTVMRLVLSGHPEEARLGIRIAGINRMAGAASILQEFLAKNTREELALEAIEALGRIGGRDVGDALLELLHSGQGPRIQVALAQAIGAMEDPHLAGRLGERALPLKSAPVSVVVAEALVRTFPEPARAMPAEAFSAYRDHVRVVWEDKDPWAHRFRLVEGLEGLFTQDPVALDEMAGLVQGLLADKRLGSSWSVDQQARAASVVKALAKRAAELRGR